MGVKDAARDKLLGSVVGGAGSPAPSSEDETTAESTKPQGLGHLSALRDFLSFLATVSGDISHITAPPFILSDSSLTQFPSYWAERPALFVAPSLESDPAKRILLVLKLYLASLQRQYYVGRAVKDGLKKPLNPFLGELFFAEFEDSPRGGEETAKVRVIAEQVSHHPPTTACFLAADDYGVRAEAYSTQHTTLSGPAVLVRQLGHALLTIDKYNETYLLPLPDVWAKSILSGVPYPELYGTYTIVSSNGYTAEMRFAGKKMFGGTKNGFEASVFATGHRGQSDLYTVSGSWSGRFAIKDASGKEIDFFDIDEPSTKPTPMKIRPLEEQSPWESRKAWGPTFEAIRKGDSGPIVREKSKLENAQREMRKKEARDGQKWETMFFTRSDADEEVFETLIDDLDNSGDVSRLRGSNGCWRFDPAKERRWKEGQGAPRAASPLG